MDADERLALQKAYADMILNISKETASRVLASERKCAMFQHELKVAKEEGVRMLVRLKQMMDNQSRDAEAVSLVQRKKIEELEAQLHEAEDIVRDLREELESVQAKLERAKNENSHCLNEVFPKEVPMENELTSYQCLPLNESSVALDLTVPTLSQEKESQDLPSIMVMDKDPDLYRNGCTQRIRACETNLLEGDLCLSEKTDEVKEAKRNLRAPALVAKVPAEFEKKLLADINLGTSKSVSLKRKRASRQKKTIQLLGGRQSHPSSKRDLSVKDMARSTENPSKIRSAKASENVRNVVEDEGETEKMEPLMQIAELSENLLSLKDVEKVDVPSLGSESKLSDTTKGLIVHPVTLKGMEIKYTYQRKRKRQALSQSEVNDSHEMGKATGAGENSDQKLAQPKPVLLKESSIGSSETVKKTGDGQKGVKKVKQPKSGCLKGTLQEHKEMLKVAKQLLSLSDGKLWP